MSKEEEVTVLVHNPSTQLGTPDQGHHLPDKSASLSDPNPPSKLRRCLIKIKDVFAFTIFMLACVVVIPLYLLYAGVAWLICNIDLTKDKPAKPNNHDSPPDNNQFYEKVYNVLEAASRMTKLPYIIRSRLVIFMMTWLIVNLAVPKLRNKFVLETKLWKWTLLVTMISCGYYLIAMVTRFLVYLLCSNVQFKKKNNGVYFVKGLKRSVNLVVLSGSILLTMVLYFRTSHGIKKTKDTDTMLHVGTWSFVTLTITAVLCVLKSVLLLKWKADAIYGRFKKRIMSAGFQVYFLAYICGVHLDVFQPKSKDEENDNQDNSKDEPNSKEEVNDNQDNSKDEPNSKEEENDNQANPKDEKEEEKCEDKVNAKDKASAELIENSTNQKKRKENNEDERKAHEILCNDDKNLNLHDIKNMTKYFVVLSRVSSREDDGSFDVLKQCRKIKPADTSDVNITVDQLAWVFDLEEKDAKYLYSKLKDDDKSNPVPYKTFEKFMVNAQKNCVALGHTLLDAQEVVKVLDNVMTAFLIAIVFIAWLLLTDIATTKILVLVASPLLGATFVFADTCKKIFEGIIFSFINHPFDVGDRCIIDKTELEVKRMSILSTTFLVIGTKKEALYPNSVLASIPIINLRGELDPSDYVELTLGSIYTKSMIDELQKNINKVFDEDKGEKYETTNTIAIKEIGDSVKMEIQYNHVMSIHETTHSQCLKKKKKQKSELLLKIKQFIDEINKKTGITTTISQELS